MASERERMLVGYTPDVDFSDVFGGPPRRSSSISNLRRRSRPDSWRSSGSRSGSGSGSGLGEQPAFGETMGKMHLKDDFFSDIFQSSESACSSPRRGEKDFLVSSSPGSQIMSPARPIKSEGVAGGLVLPVHISPSMKSAKRSVHLPNSPTQRALYRDENGSPDTLPFFPAAFVPNFLDRTVTTQEDLKNDGHVLYHQNPLSRHSHSLDKTSEVMDSTSVSTKSQSQKDFNSLESYIRKGHFHFSMYKWAGKGVTLIMPSKSNSQSESRFRRLPEMVVQEVDVILHEDTSTMNGACKSHSESLIKSVNDTIIETKVDADSTTVKGILPAEFGSKSLYTGETKTSGDLNVADVYQSNNEEVPLTSHEEFSVTSQEAQKHELMNRQQLFDDSLDRHQTEEMQAEGTEYLSRGEQSVPANINIKQQAGRENTRNPVKIPSPSTRDTVVSPEEKVLGSSVKGKVKDFIKIFNQEDPPKGKGAFETPGRGSRGKDERKGKVNDQVRVSTAIADEQVKATYGRDNSKLSDVPVLMNQDLETAEKVDFNIGFDVHIIDDFLSESKEPLHPCSDSAPDIVDASIYNMEESHYEDLEGCLVKPLLQDQSKDLQSNFEKDEIKSIDAKIREWSKGKEGNIRSLLSTLQFVLWPDSGWKLVPLVDIIEGSSVKRAYQKALLRLHPDKLQQKGASTHQKYIAEKVFDVMQEAWDHFNSISQI